MEIEIKSYVVKGEEPWDKETRWAVFNKETGEKLDDAQGYGYKSKRNAIVAWKYKNRTPAQKKASTEKRKKILNWLKEHREFAKWMDSEAFYALKDGEPFTVEDVKRMLKEDNLEIDFKPYDLLRVWRKHYDE